MAMVAVKKPPASTPYLAQRRDGDLSLTIGCSTRHWLDPLARAKSSLLLKTQWPFRARASEKLKIELFTYGHMTEAGVLFDNHPQRENRALLLDIAIVNLCADSNLENAAKHLADAVERKKNKYRGSFPATYSLPLAMSACDEVGSDVHALMKELAIRRVEHRSEIHSNESRVPASGGGDESSTSSAAILVVL